MSVHVLHRTHPPSRAASARGLLGELAVAARDLAGQSRRSAVALGSASPLVLVVAGLWVVGILGDGLTTVLMMGTGRFEEANGVAAALMGVFGVGGWVVLSSLVCVAIASLTLARPRGLYAWTGASVALVVCVVKVWTAASNALLWWSVPA